ncbi:MULTISPECIES: DUF2604 domain-containing protein [unclassified Acidiphilium]|uniref:DUF2604 domain-containing protein n=1 Tax=unclassified Acidiphilium TaxID=2617493 RepID=UPI00257F5532|nr:MULTISPECIES: DUF2604 domain-containing protein [unclassified Acidiphilium]
MSTADDTADAEHTEEERERLEREKVLLEREEERIERERERLDEEQARIDREEERIEREEERLDHDRKIDLVVLVSGVEVKIKAQHDELLRRVAERALKKSENVGQPLENWDLRNEAGEILDLDRTVGSYHLKDGALLSLTLKAGIAG